MLEQYEAVGTIYFVIDPSDGESLIDAYAIVTANVEYEPASSDCPASCNYTINPEYTVHYEINAEEIDPAMLKGCEFEVYTYLILDSNPRWATARYKTIDELIEKEKLCVEWD